jgi:hypothetical protein
LRSHTCQCGASVDTIGSCKCNAGRIQRQVFISDLMYRTKIRAGRSCWVFVRVDDKRPDDLTLLPLQSGRSVTLDVTVVDTLALSYIIQSTTNAASTAEAAASRIEAKYSKLSHSYRFYPVAIKMLGPLSVSSQLFICELGLRTALRILDPRETAFFFQRISVAIQRFNAVCLANTFVLSILLTIVLIIIVVIIIIFVYIY